MRLGEDETGGEGMGGIEPAVAGKMDQVGGGSQLEGDGFGGLGMASGALGVDLGGGGGASLRYVNLKSETMSCFSENLAFK